MTNKRGCHISYIVHHSLGCNSHRRIYIYARNILSIKNHFIHLVVVAPTARDQVSCGKLYSVVHSNEKEENEIGIGVDSKSGERNCERGVGRSAGTRNGREEKGDNGRKGRKRKRKKRAATADDAVCNYNALILCAKLSSF